METATVSETLLDAEEPPEPVQLKVYVFVPALAGVTDVEPEVGLDPVHSPEAMQEAAFVLDQVNVLDRPRAMLVGEAEIEMVGPDGGGGGEGGRDPTDKVTLTVIGLPDAGLPPIVPLIVIWPV